MRILRGCTATSCIADCGDHAAFGFRFRRRRSTSKEIRISITIISAVPDILVRVPGDMERNLTVVEVKAVKGLGGAGDDSTISVVVQITLSLLRGVFLVYGDAGRQ